MGFGQFNSTKYRPRQSKRDMLDALAPDIRDRIAESKMVARNTLRCVLVDGSIIWRLHDTNIFHRDSSGSIMLDNGGWNSMTTRDRMNQALREDTPKGVRLSVSTSGGVAQLHTPGGVTPFHRFVTCGPRGGNVRPDEDSLAMACDRRLIDAYMKEWRAESIQDLIDNSAGDPWIQPDQRGLVREDTVRDWLREQYCFAGLAVWALQFSGRRDAGQYLTLYSRSVIDRAVRAYLRACLGYG